MLFIEACNSLLLGLYGRYPDDEAGQIPMAFVVRKSDSNLCEEDVINFVAKQVNEAL
jgi:hypothetical protein